MNADSVAGEIGQLGTTNAFVYCGNNPMNRIDEDGAFFKEIGNWCKKTYHKAGNAVKKAYHWVKGDSQPAQSARKSTALTGLGHIISKGTKKAEKKLNDVKKAYRPVRSKFSPCLEEYRPTRALKAIKSIDVIATVAFIGYDLYGDYKDSGGFNKDFAMSAGVSLGCAALGALGAAFSAFPPTAVAGVAIIVFVTFATTYGEDPLKQYLRKKF